MQKAICLLRRIEKRTMKRNKIFGIQSNAFFTGLTSFFTDTSTKMVYSVMPLFLLSIGVSKTTTKNEAGKTFGFQKAMISDIVSKDLKGTGFGIYHAVLGITLLPASLIAGLLYDNVNSTAPFYFGSAMALAAAILMIIFTIVDKRKQKVNLICT